MRSNAAYGALGNLSQTLCLASIIVSVARFGDAKLVGQFSYSLAICTPWSLLAALRLRDLKATDVAGVYSTRDFLWLSFYANILAVPAVAITCYLLRVEANTFLIAALLSAWRGINNLCSIVYGHHQQLMKMRIVAKLQFSHGIVSAGLFILVFLLSGELAIAVGTLFVSQLLLFLCVDLPSMDEGMKKSEPTDLKTMRQLGMVAMPLGAAGAIFSLNQVAPRALLERFFDLETVGVFASLIFFTRFGTPVMQALGQAASSRLARHYATGDIDRFARMLLKAAFIPLAVGAVLVVIAGLAGPRLLVLIFGEEYVVDGIDAVLVMSYATMVQISTVLTYGIIASRHLVSYFLILVMTVLTVLVAGIVLIPDCGLHGACWALVISSAVRTVLTVGVNVFATLGLRNRLSLDNNQLKLRI